MEDVAALAQQGLHVLGDVAAGDIDAAHGGGDGEPFVDGHGVGDAVAGVEDATGGTAAGVQGQHGLDGGIEGGDVEGLEEDLGGGVAVGAGVEGGFGEQDGMFFAHGLEALAVDVLPDLLHVVPVGDDAVLERVADLQQTAQLGGGFLADEDLPFEGAGQDAQMLGPADEGGEVALGQIVTGESCPYGPRPVVEHDGRVV